VGWLEREERGSKSALGVDLRVVRQAEGGRALGGSNLQPRIDCSDRVLVVCWWRGTSMKMQRSTSRALFVDDNRIVRKIMEATL
jgi:hypothetical protein